MTLPEWTKPAIWGAAAGAVVAMIIGFAWGGWVTGGTARDMASTRADSAVIQAFTPLCVAKAEQQPDQHALLKEESSWRQDDFVIDAGWVDNVKESHRTGVARACATAVLAAMEDAPATTN